MPMPSHRCLEEETQLVLDEMRSFPKDLTFEDRQAMVAAIYQLAKAVDRLGHSVAWLNHHFAQMPLPTPRPAPEAQDTRNKAAP